MKEIPPEDKKDIKKKKIAKVKIPEKKPVIIAKKPELPKTKEEWYELYYKEETLEATRTKHGRIFEVLRFKEWKREKISSVKSGIEIKDGQLEMSIADEFIKQHLLSSVVETERLHIWIDGVFKTVKHTNSIIESYITKYAKISKTYIGATSRELIKRLIKSMRWTDLIDWEQNNYKINVLNGILTYDEDDFTWIFEEHSRGTALKTFIQIPVYYDPTAKCPDINKFLLETVGEKQIELIYRMIGYVLLPTISEQKCFFLIGPENTGETTFLELIKLFFGYDNISSLDMYRFGANFQIHDTANMVANIIDDLPNLIITHASCGWIKRICSSSRLRGEIKNIQGKKKWNNRCKSITACNTLPETQDKTDPFYKRIVGLEFFNQIPKKNQIKELHLKLVSDKEFSGLLNLALEAYIRLVKGKGFGGIWNSIPKTKEWWMRNMNPLEIFVEEYCDTGSSNYRVDYKKLINKINEVRESVSSVPFTGNTITRHLKRIEDRIRTIDVDKIANPKSCGKDYMYIRLKNKPKSIKAEILAEIAEVKKRHDAKKGKIESEDSEDWKEELEIP